MHCPKRGILWCASRRPRRHDEGVRSRRHGVSYSVQNPQLYFTSPRLLPRAEKLQGRVVVLDVAFAATFGTTVSFDLVTRPFIDGLGSRLAAWVDHHDHERHAEF